MRAASYHQSAYGSRTSLRSRAASALLAIAIGALLIIGLMTLGVFPDRRVDAPVLATFDVRPKAEVTSSGARPAPLARPTRRPENPTPVVTPPLPPTPFPDMIILTRQDFAATDIGRIRSSPRDAAKVADAASSGSGATVGTGPDGQAMYRADWYREPTLAELATYMPKRRVEPGARGVIICRMVERYRVEDCRERGETPGSGLARTMRQASWQFLIRPPRVGGKPLLGSWVEITWDYGEAKE